MLECAGQMHSRFFFFPCTAGRKTQMTFPGQFPICVCAVGYHVSHKRRRKRKAAEVEWLTNNRHVCPPPHLNWRCRSQDQGSGSPHWSHCELWCRVNSAGRKMIFFFSSLMALCKIRSKFSTLKSPVFHQQLQGSWQGVRGIYLKFICPVLS